MFRRRLTNPTPYGFIWQAKSSNSFRLPLFHVKQFYALQIKRRAKFLALDFGREPAGQRRVMFTGVVEKVRDVA